MDILIRKERAEDVAAIEKVVRSAFGQDEEVRLVARLRATEDRFLSLVAEADGTLAGHIGFARAWVRSNGRRVATAWLVPLSVVPDRQNRGIGTALVRAGLDACRDRGFAYALVVGDPAYYGRFGFSRAAAEGIVSRWRDALLAATLIEGADPLQGSVVEPAAFDAIAQCREGPAAANPVERAFDTAEKKALE